MNDIASNLNGAIESCLADLDNLQPKAKPVKPKKRKGSKQAANPSKKLKIKPTSFLKDEVIEGLFYSRAN